MVQYSDAINLVPTNNDFDAYTVNIDVGPLR